MHWCASSVLVYLLSLISSFFFLQSPNVAAVIAVCRWVRFFDESLWRATQKLAHHCIGLLPNVDGNWVHFTVMRFSSFKRLDFFPFFPTNNLHTDFHYHFVALPYTRLSLSLLYKASSLTQHLLSRLGSGFFPLMICFIPGFIKHWLLALPVFFCICSQTALTSDIGLYCMNCEKCMCGCVSVSGLACK